MCADSLFIRWIVIAFKPVFQGVYKELSTFNFIYICSFSTDNISRLYTMNSTGKSYRLQEAFRLITSTFYKYTAQKGDWETLTETEFWALLASELPVVLQVMLTL